MRGDEELGSIGVVGSNGVQAPDDLRMGLGVTGNALCHRMTARRERGGARAVLVVVITGSPGVQMLPHVGHSRAVRHENQSVARFERGVRMWCKRALTAQDRDDVRAVAVESGRASGYTGMHTRTVCAKHSHEQTPAARDIHRGAGAQQGGEIELVELVGVVGPPPTKEADRGLEMLSSEGGRVSARVDLCLVECFGSARGSPAESGRGSSG